MKCGVTGSMKKAFLSSVAALPSLAKPRRTLRGEALPGTPLATTCWASPSGHSARDSSNGLLRATSFALYLEDTWKITPRLTLNIGLRYENTPPYHDKYRGIINVQFFDPGWDRKSC